MHALLSLALAVLLQDPPAPDAKDQAAKSAIAEFTPAFKKAKTPDEKVKALQALNRVPHPLILKELIKSIKQEDVGVRKAVYFEISKYPKSKSAGEALVKVLAAEAALAKLDPNTVYAGQDMFTAACQAICAVKYKAAVPALTAYFNHANLEVGKAALRACGELKSIEAVDAMIAVLREWANAKVDDPYAKNASGTSKGDPGFFVKHGTGSNSGKPAATYSPDELQKIDKFNRKNQLPETANASLFQCTGQEYKALADWEKWWGANKTQLLKDAKDKAKSGDPGDDEE